MCEECNFDINCLQASAGVFLYTKSKRTKIRTETRFFYKFYLLKSNIYRKYLVGDKRLELLIDTP